MSVLSVPEVRKALGWSPERDRDAADLIAEVEDLFERLTGRRLGVVTDYEWTTRLEIDESYILLPVVPITSLKAVGWDDEDEEPADFSEPLTERDDYYLDKHDGMFKPVVFYDRYKFQLTGGTTANDSPALRAALIAEVIYSRQRDAVERAAFTALRVDDGNAQFRRSMHHPKFVACVHRHRREP